ncbi:TlpA disulfide reductase family protein [Mucilaginibacter sp. KACC 22773]|uniref:TlpA family protein disulfide reductase n=1 Tax=Mucilaginibacter sp. KACC 22773 TaxID=3025671 RepID=UPI0023659363|nr:TlpA disulfide reductase family protein [Mucilaginibacter sp. KACC 22773]WDF80062.1 TlpA disulfide reductase family protein [Mucilaginibacter sp. KACC 22773]
MKNLLLAALVFCSSYLSAQNLPAIAIEDKKMDAYLMNRKPATLTVQIKNLPDSVKKINIKYTLVQLGGSMQATKYAETDATGQVKIILDENLPYQQIWLDAGNYLYTGIYVDKGLTVTVDTRKVPKDGAYMIGEGITFSGYDGELNTVMNKKVLFKKKERERLVNDLRAVCNWRKKYTADAFTFKTDSVLRLLKSIDSEFISGYPKYGWAVNNETLSEFYGEICIAYWNDTIPGQLIKQINAHQPIFTSNDGVMFYKYLGIYTMAKKRFKKESALNSIMMLCDSLYTQQRSDLLKLFLLESEKDNYARTYPMIISSIKTAWCKKIAADEMIKVDDNQKRIDSVLALSTKLEKADIGTPLIRLPFDASLYQLDTIANIDSFILNLKAKFPNKALIIDFWATWCAPCIADMPFSKSLHQKNKDLPVEYIYLCTTSSSSIDIWKNRIGEMQIPGTHIYVNDKIIARLKTVLNAEGGFPTYVVIDVNGKVNKSKITRMEALDRESLKKNVGL